MKHKDGEYSRRIDKEWNIVKFAAFLLHSIVKFVAFFYCNIVKFVLFFNYVEKKVL